MTLVTRANILLGILVLLLPSTNSALPARADSDQPLLNFVCTDSDRFGVWHPPLSGIEAYDVGQLHAGWYNNWSVVENPAHPAGLRFVQLVRIAQGEAPPGVDAACFDALSPPQVCPTWDEVEAIALSNPGSLWLIGNEPDRRYYQDDVEPARYAEIYHEFYTHLKAVDPTSQVAVGGVVQPTPIRLAYLDAILNAYKAQNDEAPMPVDVWNVHNYVLREERDSWGCDVPPGYLGDSGMPYLVEEHDNVDIWTGHLTAMRQWMADRGYRNRPLIVSEFGILMPETYANPPFDHARVRKFMLATFDWMMTAIDPSTGYPADGNRLVQAWSWYSLSEDVFENYEDLTFHSHLFDPDTLAITPLGVDYGHYAAPLTTPFPGSVDLRPTAIWRSRPLGSAGGPENRTVYARVLNSGAAPAANVVVRFERDGVPDGEATIASIAPGETETASVLWTGLDPEVTYEATATVSASAQTVECNPFNNVHTVTLWLGDHWIFLPVGRKK